MTPYQDPLRHPYQAADVIHSRFDSHGELKAESGEFERKTYEDVVDHLTNTIQHEARVFVP